MRRARAWLIVGAMKQAGALVEDPVAHPLSLFAAGPPGLGHNPKIERVELDPCCWVDYGSGFLDGGDELLHSLRSRFDWSQGRRLMYGTWHDEPRLTARMDLDDPAIPSPVIEAVDALSAHYGRSFDGLFCNYYQSGQHSVAWHADRIGQTSVDPLVAIISLGGPRRFSMREKGRTQPSQRWTMHSGDLLVMGGSTQHHWEHAIVKTRSAPPRMSLTTRAGFKGFY